MAINKSILIRVDASLQIGLGHLMRCLALAETLCQESGVTVIIKEPDEAILSLIRQKGISCWIIPDTASIKEDIALVNNWIKSNKPLAVICDGYHLDANYQKEIITSGIIVHIGLIRDNNMVADIIINPNPWAEPNQFLGKHKPTASLLAGADYVMIGNNIREAKSTKLRKDLKRVLLSFGGGSLNEKLFDIYNAIKDLNYKYDLMLGLIDNRNQVHKLENATLHLKMFETASVMQEADLAICAAGSICWELCYLGVPFINFITADNQKYNAEYLSNNDISISIGDISGFDAKLFKKTVINLAADYNKRKNMSEKGRELIDGEGTKRIVAEIFHFNKSATNFC